MGAPYALDGPLTDVQLTYLIRKALSEYPEGTIFQSNKHDMEWRKKEESQGRRTSICAPTYIQKDILVKLRLGESWVLMYLTPEEGLI